MNGNGFVEVTREESEAASLRFGCSVFEDGRTGQRLLPAELANRLRSAPR